MKITLNETEIKKAIIMFLETKMSLKGSLDVELSTQGKGGQTILATVDLDSEDLGTKKETVKEVKEFKRKKFDDGYHTISDTTEFNEIEKVFHLDKHLTANEVIKKVEEPEFYTKWLEAKKGKVKDKTKGKTPERPDATTSSGMPSAEPTPVSNPFA